MLEKTHTPASLHSQQGEQASIELRETNLSKRGFSSEDIALIKTQVPDLNVRILQAQEGSFIGDTALDAAALSAQEGAAVVFSTCGVVVVALPGQDGFAIQQSIRRAIEEANTKFAVPETVAERDAQENTDRQEILGAYEQLPKYLKAWVDIEGEGVYGRDLNIEIARDAHRVAQALETEPKIRAWVVASLDERKNQVPGVGTDHSGGSLSQVARLAIRFLKEE